MATHESVRSPVLTPDTKRFIVVKGFYWNNENRAAYYVLPQRDVPQVDDPTTVDDSEIETLVSKISFLKISKESEDLKGECDALALLTSKDGHEKYMSSTLVEFDMQENRGAWLQTSVVNGIDLRDFARDCNQMPPLEFFYHIFVQVFDALSFVHSFGFIHHDVDIGNIMLTNAHKEVPDVVLVDFGNAYPENDEPNLDGAELMEAIFALVKAFDPHNAEKLAEKDPFIKDCSSVSLLDPSSQEKWPMDVLKARWYDIAKQESAKLQSLPEWMRQIIMTPRITRKEIEYAMMNAKMLRLFHLSSGGSSAS